VVRVSPRRAAGAREPHDQAAPDAGLVSELIDHAPLLIFVQDVDGRYRLVNRCYEEFVGKKRCEIIGRTAREVFSARLADPFSSHALDVLDDLQPVERRVAGFHHDSGLRTLLSVTFPLVDASGRARAVCGIATDVTDRIAEEEQRRIEELASRSERLEAVGHFAASIAHDFNNLLTVIINYTNLLEKRIDDEALRADLAEVEDAAHKGSQLTRRLLTFLRRGLGNPEAIDVNDVVADMTDVLDVVLGDDVVLDIVLQPRLRPVMVQPGALEQALMNLAVNSREAMPRGGTLTIQTRSIAGSPLGLSAGDYVELVVTDTGHGMPPDVARQAWEPFFSTKCERDGSGLGLATVYRLAKSAGGAVELKTHEGEGTTVTLVLPAVTAKAYGLTPLPLGLLHGAALLTSLGS
jgi:two-component system cell cycle sensor histidine kinase/response regulator CckA